ncbi:MAG TPA: DegT/DnrJ/EryC1/StrS family aminotransferase [Bellilinea sp.]|mgnify:CR=1 FL=1|nr:DegT/DnrJ/EryC1/StrS family aminotransferase [Bellilinea sp.]
MIPISKPFIGEEEKQLVMEVLNSGMLAQGPRVAELEQKFAHVCGTKHAIATTSGTTALHTAMLAHGIGDGDEVITSSFTFIASVNSILFTGAKPVFADIDPKTFNIVPELIEKAITPRTKAILPVHLYGHVADMESILAIAEKHNLAVIEDACQAVGATFKDKKAGSFGTGCFSLYATKNVMSGEGGIITTDDDHIAEQCKLIRSHGMKIRYHHEMLGYNYRMSDLHAAIGIAQLNRLDAFTAARKKNAEYLNSHIHGVITPSVAPDFGHVWHQYTIQLPEGMDRDTAVKKLGDAGVGTGVFYPIPAHQQKYIQDSLGTVSLPVTEDLAKRVISLPVHPQLSQEDLDTIVKAVNSL